jgi:hypothetical protein
MAYVNSFYVLRVNGTLVTHDPTRIERVKLFTYVIFYIYISYLLKLPTYVR